MSAGGGAVLAATAPQLYFCYQCNRTVSLTPSPNADLLCPTCNGGFLEEYENPNPIPNLDPFPHFPDPLSGFISGLPFLFSTLQSPRPASAAHDPARFDPFSFLQSHLSNLAAGGANIEFVIANDSDELGFQLPANLGDYFIGPGLEQLIQQLAENDPNRYGTPPASKSAVENLPSVTVDDGLLSSDLAQCAVCKDDFERGMEVKQMPCKHVYHSDCIVPWLELHNSCPVCRYELPTDDPDYESTREASDLGNSDVGSGSGGGGSHRRFRITLPWPFGSGESSGGNNSGWGPSSGGQQNRDIN
ncbi:E3 ubiquitin-protein ligase RING1-like [Actinidia eriantha]|uniref:E3 ubiquitin-protein ligase RING1-like n=1 Tax=Actinidia eriantha TaxID=165200 RepID=UPI00259122D7|nr:E3 ubiquitin-protein ligase RING1-like [Actinidia eriantha]XP_057508870.1 E3 ubiquitin-protein ligase RING1-like [Actinidia eriantha]XP_057508871.1 E3 ubiquitin-protein ligase RING1-like [Actinidia eriantha]